MAFMSSSRTPTGVAAVMCFGSSSIRFLRSAVLFAVKLRSGPLEAELSRIFSAVREYIRTVAAVRTRRLKLLNPVFSPAHQSGKARQCGAEQHHGCWFRRHLNLGQQA